MTTTVTVDGSSLDRASLVRVAREGAPVAMEPGVTARMTASRAVVERALDAGAAVYGLSTAVGVLKRVEVATEEAAYSRSVLRTHRVAQGPPAPADLVRATMLRLLNADADGTKGVRPALAERLHDAARLLDTLTVPLGAGTALAHAVVWAHVATLAPGDTVPDVGPLVDRLRRDPLPRKAGR